MTDRIHAQISNVLSDKSINPFDIPAVEFRAYKNGFTELIRFLEKNREWYIDYLINTAGTISQKCESCKHCPF